MLVNCCYRLIVQGEVIHSTYDSNTCEIFGMPKEFFDAERMQLGDISGSLYKEPPKMDDSSLTGYAAMCEAMLLSDEKYAIVVEFCNQGYYIVEWDGTLRFKVAPTDMQDISRLVNKPDRGLYRAIGYRNTKARQLRASQGIYRLTYCEKDNTIHTNDGIIIPDFDVSTLSPIDHNYKGYKDMVANTNYAVVYIEGEPVFCYLTSNNILKLSGRRT